MKSKKAPAASEASAAACAVEKGEADGHCCRGHKRQTVLEAAARAFAHQDYHKVRTEEIAAAAGVGKGTLFRFFSSKEELFVATAVYCVEVASAEMDRALAGIVEPVERLETACEHLVGFYQEHDYIFHLLHHHKVLRDQAVHAEFHRRQNELRAKIYEIIRAGQGAGRFRRIDPTIAGRLLFGMLRTAMRIPELKERPAGEIAKVILDLFVNGAGRCRKDLSAAGAVPDAAPPGKVRP